MAGKGFTHLHLHSQYSLLDGAIGFGKLFDRCKELGMDSVAVTDHGNMFGAVEFYVKAKAAGIKPIIGIEAYIAPDSRFNKQKTSISDASSHLVLLAENNAGYKNLLKLSSIGFTEGFYYRPRIDKEILAQHSEGIICLTACLGGEIPQFLANGDEKAALKAAEDYVKIFGKDRFFIELQKHATDDVDVTGGLISIAEKMGLGMVVTNDVHFLNEDDYEAHNCLTCIGTGKLAEDENRMIYPPDIYLKSPEEMRQIFPDIPQACDNTLVIAERCNVEIDLKSRHAPVFRPEDGSTPEDFLTKLCYERAKVLYGEITEEVKARIDRELEVIEGKGFASYFLINWEFCNWATKNNIPVGARGSGVGTIVGYCLGLCNVDPIKYGLLFERFMDPERDEMPDIDIDMCQVNRPRLIEYVRQKYGHVAQIITFGTMKARAVIRDVCRVKDIPLAQADKLAKLIPEGLGVTLDKAIEAEPELKEIYDNDQQIHDIIEICKRLEGLVRHSSVHAAGVVIADQDLTDFIPVYKTSGSDDIITQYEGPMVEKVGLLKMDFLGLKTLSVLELAKKLVKEKHGVDIDLEKIDIKDEKVFQLFTEGRTKGVFQFESGGMADLLMKMKPDRLEDLIAANALYRPGPMTLIPDYIARKHGQKWSTPHPIMTEVLEETYGIMIYQEQVMQICNRLGDIKLREAYSMIKAISKKKLKIIAAGRETFIANCQTKGLTEAQAIEIFDLIEKFAGYGFNKSHSTRYAFIAYQTAYLKKHWPAEFMAALITYENQTDKVVDYIGECKSMGIEVLAPDINESLVSFTPIYVDKEDGEGKKEVIRFGLGAIKGVGEKAVEKIIEARDQIGKFKSLFHFCENVELRAANKQVIESLIKAGAFDRLGGNRCQMMAGLETAMQSGNTMQADKLSGQMNLFGGGKNADEYADDHNKLPNVAPWTEKEMLAKEKEVLGFYVTSNPLSRYAEMIDIYSTHNSTKLGDCRQDAEIFIGGMITKIRQIVTRNGRNAGSKMAVFVLEDLQGEVEVVMFPSTLSEYGELVEEDKIVFVKGKVDRKRETPNIFAEELLELDDVPALANRASIKFNAANATREKAIAMKKLCQDYPGKIPINILIETDKGNVHAEADKSLTITPDFDFCREVDQLIGTGNLKVRLKKLQFKKRKKWNKSSKQ